MSRRKRIVVLPLLKDRGGDIHKPWYIEYQVRDARTDKMGRFRVQGNLNAIFGKNKKETIALRTEAAKPIIEAYTEKLKAGWTPYNDSSVIYEDELMYHNAALVYGKRKKSNINIRVYSSAFLSEIKRSLKPKTYESYQSKIRIFTMWLESEGLGDVDASAITPDIIQRFFNMLIDKKLSKRTVEKYGLNIQNLFKSLVRDKKITDNPVQSIPSIPPTVDCSAKPIRPDDLVILKAEVQRCDPQLWLAMQFEFYCFIRPGTELRLMRVSWIDTFTSTITIPEEFSKNGKRQPIVIPAQFLEILIRDYYIDKYNKDFYLFGNNRMPGTVPMGKNTLRNRFNLIRDRLKLSKEYKFYSMKHTGAIMASNAGIPVKDIQMQMRHHSLDVTDKYLRKMKGTDSDALKNRFPTI